MMDARYIATVFVDAINSRDLEALCLLMTENHVFTDSCGNDYRGCDIMREVWRDYFLWFPYYRIHVDRILVDSGFVVLIGSASGIASRDTRWAIPSVWTAQIEGNRVSEWRVYADNTPLHAVLGRKN